MAIGMEERHHIWAIFARCLGFLTVPGLDSLVDFAGRSSECASVVLRIQRYLDKSSDALREEVLSLGEDEEVSVAFNVLLWKKKVGLIVSDVNVQYQFQKQENAWCTHRLLVETGSSDIATLELTQDSEDEPGRTYEGEINRLLDLYSRERRWEEEVLIDLPVLLNVAGPALESFARHAEVLSFVEALMADYDNPQIGMLSVAAFAILLCDLGLPAEASWPAYRHLIERDEPDIFTYPALLVGLRMYGERCATLIQRLAIPAGFKLLSELALR